jgi:hypothetical protein
MLVNTTVAAAAANAIKEPGVRPFLGLAAASGQVDVNVFEDSRLSTSFNPVTGLVDFSMTNPEGVSLDWTGVTAQASIAWAQALPTLPDSGNVQAGSYYLYDGEIVYIIQAHNRGTFGGSPFQTGRESITRLFRDPWRVYPWKAPIDQFDAYLLMNAITGAPDEATHAGQTWRTRRNNNTWTPGTSDSGWMRISNLPAPWIHVGNEGYPLGWEVTHNGRRWQAGSANLFWEPGVFGWTDIGPA